MGMEEPVRLCFIKKVLLGESCAPVSPTLGRDFLRVCGGTAAVSEVHRGDALARGATKSPHGRFPHVCSPLPLVALEAPGRAAAFLQRIMRYQLVLGLTLSQLVTTLAPTSGVQQCPALWTDHK